MPRLRVLWLSHLVPYPPQGGAAQRSYHLLREASRRHSVHLVALNQRARLGGPGGIEVAVRELSRVCERMRAFSIPWDRSRLHRIAVAAASVLHRDPYEVNWLYSPAMHAYVRALARETTYDLIHVDTLGLMPYARPFEPAPVVLTHHDVEWHLVARRADAERGAARAYFRWEAEKIVRFQRRVAARVALHVAVSALDAERLGAFDPRAKTTVVDNGVDVEYFRPGASGRSEEGGLVFMGLLNCFPNRDAVSYFLTAVWPGLVADDPRRRITIVGREPPPELLALAAGDARVSILGNVPDVRPHLDVASIFVCPLRVGGGTRLKVLDALAAGKPLVATTLSVEGLDIVDGEHYLRADTPAAFVAQIRRLEADAALRRRLAQAGRARVVERYGWERIGEKLGRAYELVTTERAGRGEAATSGRPLRSPAVSAISTYNRSR